MIKIASFLLTAMVLLVPRAGACIYPDCDTVHWSPSSPNSSYTFDYSSGGTIDATAAFQWTGRTTPNYTDTITVTITQLVNIGLGLIQGIGFDLVASGTPSSPTGLLSIGPSPNPDYVMGLQDAVTSVGPGGAVTTTVSFRDTNSALTIGGVYFVYGTWSPNWYEEESYKCANGGFNTPEPASMALMGLGLLVIPIVVRRRRRSS